MDLRHPLTAFLERDRPATAPDYWYEGDCPRTRQRWRLPRTKAAEAIARRLMQQLAAADRYQQEGKMYGVLLAQTPAGEPVVLKAFSGLLNGQSDLAGWVPPIPGRAQVSLLEIQTLQQLEQIKQALIGLQQLPERALLAEQEKTFQDQLNALTVKHRQRKQERDRLRQQYTVTLTGSNLQQVLDTLMHQSQQDGGDRRRLKRQRDQALFPLRQAVADADAQITALKRQRRDLSRQLQAQMHTAYALTNFAGETAALQSLWPTGLPTGTGDCAAPKLLHYAATHQFKPLALAEFWWGPATTDKQPGQFYGACKDRCQPIMGFLLSGLSATILTEAGPRSPVSVLYEDEALLVIDKPSGLLSVPGRTSNLQDSVVSRLRGQRPHEQYLAAVHRIDQGTSGILVVAKTAAAHRALHQQFAQRQVQKTYEAVLSRPIVAARGLIELPLWRDPRDRPKTCVHYQYGKPSQTTYELLAASDRPRLRFIPHTGRTHQLRVHAAHPQGLDSPILGDPLYGADNNTEDPAPRLHLHARAIRLTHPTTNQTLEITSQVPF
ncbi:MAG: pseudouridine synthase [Cyanobacteria bacterium P01_C01_bin.120]